MTESSGKARGLNKLAIAVFLAVLVVGGSFGVWFAQNGCARNASVSSAARGSSSVTVHFIDVGQGDSILIDTPGEDVLIDGGPTSAGSTVVSYLSSLGITRIHMMIATHVHEDHIGGLVAVLHSITNVDEVLINNQTSTSKTYTDFMNLARGHTIAVAQRGQTFILMATANLTVFNPVQPLEFTSENDNSVVVKLRVGNVSFLLTGDAEADAEQSMLNAGLDLKSDVLKVGHHGSRTATTQPFLDSVAPSYAVISAGVGNPYGHPHPETVQKLLAKGVTTYGTFQSGTIVASTDGASIVFQDSPQPVPEFQSRITLSFLVTATLLAVAVYGRKRSHVFNL